MTKRRTCGVRGVAVAAMLAVALAVQLVAAADGEEAERVQEAATVLAEIMEAPDQAIPNVVISDAAAIAVFPSTYKGGFIFGGHRGRGIISVRDEATGEWSPPAFLTLTGASFGAQIGGQAVDVVLVVRNHRGVEQIISNQFKIGGDASVVAGPVGRAAEASTDIQLRAEILSYSRTRGLFAGVSLKGSSVRQDRDANERFYGYPHKTGEVVLDSIANVPESPALDAWRDALERYTR